LDSNLITGWGICSRERCAYRHQSRREGWSGDIKGWRWKNQVSSTNPFSWKKNISVGYYQFLHAMLLCSFFSQMWIWNLTRRQTNTCSTHLEPFSIIARIFVHSLENFCVLYAQVCMCVRMHTIMRLLALIIWQRSVTICYGSSLNPDLPFRSNFFDPSLVLKR